MAGLGPHIGFRKYIIVNARLERKRRKGSIRRPEVEGDETGERSKAM